MKKLDRFSKEYCRDIRIKVGEEYKVIDIERDPFYGQLPSVYQKQLYLEGIQNYTFEKEIYHTQQLITDYFTGEYTETTDEEFQSIWEKFFYHWYWEDIYICYSNEVLYREIESWKDRLDINRQYCQSDNPYRLFKLVKRLSPTKAVFSSVWTGLNYEIDEEVIPMVWASANKGYNWIHWRFLIREFIASEQIFITNQKLVGKRLLRKRKNIDNANIEDLNLSNTHPVFDVDVTDLINHNKYNSIEITSPEVASGIWDNNLNWFMTRSGWLGYMQNMNDKRERLTTGENFKDLHAVSNIQYRNLKNLNDFGRRFGKAYSGKELNFNVSNWGEAQGIPQGEFGGEEIDNVGSNDRLDSNEDKE